MSKIVKQTVIQKRTAGRVSTPCEKTAINPNDIMRVIRKRDLLDLRRYEVREHYEFNQQPSDEFLKGMPDDLVMPVTLATIHNGVEVRCQATIDKAGHEVRVDMPIKMFFALQQRDKRTGAVVKVLPVPCNLPKAKPRKGRDVYRVLRKAQLVEFINADREYALTGSGVTVDQFVASIPDDAEVEIAAAAFTNTKALVCTVATKIGGTHQFVSFVMPAETYFSLPTQTWKWPGWSAIKTANAQDTRKVA